MAPYFQDIAMLTNVGMACVAVPL